MTSKVRCEIENNIAVITLNSPPMNALDIEVMDGLRETFGKLHQVRDLRVVIVTGQGRAFVAGADIKEFTSWTETSAEDFTEKGQRIFSHIANFPCPVIAAINGFAFGGGLELALACDIRLASEKASMGLPETTLGIIPGYGGTQRLARTIGIGKAKKMIFSADPVDAGEAARVGLVDGVYHPDKLMDEAMALAEKIASRAPIAIRNAKAALNAGRDVSLEQGLRVELALATLCFATEDKIEGVDAFVNKRKAEFKNK
jgi:enoyl-CoA hydratase